MSLKATGAALNAQKDVGKDLDFCDGGCAAQTGLCQITRTCPLLIREDQRIRQSLDLGDQDIREII